MRNTGVTFLYVGLLILQTAAVEKAAGCLIDSCCSPVSTSGGVLLVCPAGDGPALSSIGATVDITCISCNCIDPVPGIPKMLTVDCYRMMVI